MESTTKWIVGAIVIVIALLAWSVKNQSGQTQSEKSFKIGSMIPLSGEFAALGEEVHRGAEVAVAEAKARGEKFEYISEDDGFVPTKGASAANKLTQIDKVDAAFTSTVQEVKAMDRIFNQAKTPLLTAWDSNEYIKTAGDHIYSIGFSTEAAGQVMADFASKDLGLKKVAVVYVEDEWSTIISDAFQREYTELGGEVVSSEKVQPTLKDFRSVIAKAKLAKADGIYFPLFPTYCGVFIKQARELGFTGKLLTADSFTDEDIAVAGSATEGTFISALFADNAEKVREGYKKMYKNEPAMPIFAAIGYDAINTLLEARRISKTEHVTLDKALTMVKLAGAVGEIDMAGKRYHERIERINIVKDGKIVEVKK